MRMNLYDFLFYSFYDVMSRQGNQNQNDDKIDGFVWGAILLSIAPFLFLMDLIIILGHYNILDVSITKITIIVFLILLMGFNILYFRTDKRYTKIENEFKIMSKKKRRYNLITSRILVLLLIIGFFALLQLK